MTKFEILICASYSTSHERPVMASRSRLLREESTSQWSGLSLTRNRVVLVIMVDVAATTKHTGDKALHALAELLR